MTHQFPSDGWFEELQRRLNADEEYADQASGYGVEFDGDYVFTVEAGDGLAETVHYYIGLEDGACTDTYEVASPGEADAGFELSAPYGVWKQVVRGELGAVEGIMSGSMELDGSLNTLMQYQEAASTFVETCAEIDTEFV